VSQRGSILVAAPMHLSGGAAPVRFSDQRWSPSVVSQQGLPAW
jgi:hypothetical protein